MYGVEHTNMEKYTFTPPKFFVQLTDCTLSTIIAGYETEIDYLSPSLRE